MLKSLDIGKRLLIGFGAIGVLMVVASALVLLSYRSMAATLDRVTVQTRNSTLIQDGQHSALKTVFYLEAAASAAPGSPSLEACLQKVASNRAEYLADLAELHAHLDPAGQTLLAEVESTMLQSRTACLQVGALIQAGKSSEASQLFSAEAIPRIEGWRTAFSQLDRYGQDQMAQSIAGTRALIGLDTRIIWAGAALGLVAVGLLAVAITRSIVGPISGFKSVLAAVAQGDLTVAARVDAQDEIGQLGVSLNHALAQLRTSLREVATSSASVASGATELSASAEQMTTATQEIARSGEQLQGATGTVAGAIEQFRTSVAQVAGNVERSAQLAEKAVTATETGSQGSRDASAGMDRVRESTLKISRILGVIQGIAQQTNLLSLNAAIEAAKAGDHGKGFAVVADEVRKLAEDSHAATLDIEALVAETRAAVAAGASSVLTTSDMMTHIHQAVTDVSTRMGQIGLATREQTLTAGAIAQQMDDSAQEVGQNATATQQLSATVQEISRTASELARVAESMALSVARFQV
jgi:methyl-accepting chemotaxis protein